jgi:hypothetical protein
VLAQQDLAHLAHAAQQDHVQVLEVLVEVHAEVVMVLAVAVMVSAVDAWSAQSQSSTRSQSMFAAWPVWSREDAVSLSPSL